MASIATQAAVPPYIKANAGFYSRIAEEFYELTASAHMETEYENTLQRFCRKHMREMTDENVLQYLLSTGELDREDVLVIKQYYMEHAGALQSCILNAGLVPGEKYTLVYYSEFGFPVMDNVLFLCADPIQYAQHTDAVQITVRRAGKRRHSELVFYDCEIAVYAGWHSLKREDTYTTEKRTDTVVIEKSKYGSFDKRYFEDVTDRLGKPLAVHRRV